MPLDRKDKAWLEWVRGLPCFYLDCQKPAEPHHPKGDLHLSGAGLKAPDILAMPVCREHHARLHGMEGDWRLEQREGIIRTLIRALEEGMLKR